MSGIQRQDFRLSQPDFRHNREERFPTLLSECTRLIPCKQPHGLHRKRRGSRNNPSRPYIGHGCTHYGNRINTEMIIKTFILKNDHRLSKFIGNLAGRKTPLTVRSNRCAEQDTRFIIKRIRIRHIFRHNFQRKQKNCSVCKKNRCKEFSVPYFCFIR